MKINISFNRTCGVSWYQWTCFVKEYNLLCSIKWTIIFMTALSIITLMILYRWLWKTWSIRSTWRNPRKLRGSSPQRSDSFIHSFIHPFIFLFIYSFIHWVSQYFSPFFWFACLFYFQLFYFSYMYMFVRMILRTLCLFTLYLLKKKWSFSILLHVHKAYHLSWTILVLLVAFSLKRQAWWVICPVWTGPGRD